MRIVKIKDIENKHKQLIDRWLRLPKIYPKSNYSLFRLNRNFIKTKKLISDLETFKQLYNKYGPWTVLENLLFEERNEIERLILIRVLTGRLHHQLNLFSLIVMISFIVVTN